MVGVVTEKPESVVQACFVHKFQIGLWVTMDTSVRKIAGGEPQKHGDGYPLVLTYTQHLHDVIGVQFFSRGDRATQFSIKLKIECFQFQSVCVVFLVDDDDMPLPRVEPDE